MNVFNQELYNDRNLKALNIYGMKPENYQFIESKYSEFMKEREEAAENLQFFDIGEQNGMVEDSPPNSLDLMSGAAPTLSNCKQLLSQNKKLSR